MNYHQHLEGSFGLVWDGDSSKTCSGVFGEYLRYNNSHKASLYLASGFPIIVWGQSALANFVLEKECGISVESLLDLEEVLEHLSQEKYQDLVKNAKSVGQKIREGSYLLSALQALN